MVVERLSRRLDPVLRPGHEYEEFLSATTFEYQNILTGEHILLYEYEADSS